MKKDKKINWKIQLVFVLLFSLTLSLTPLPEQKAKAWETWGSIPMGVGIDKMIDQLMIVITGAAKQAAIKMITQNVYMSVSGGSGGGGTKFIVNWQTALETDPQKAAAVYIESMSSASTRLSGSSNYTSSEGVGGNYMSGLNNIVINMTSQAASSNKCPLTYTGNPANMFADGTFKNFSKFMSGNNNPWSYQTCMQNAYEEKLNSLKEIAKTQATAYLGGVGTGTGGNITYPGSLVMLKIANVENMGNQVIASAEGIPEVITSIVMKMAMDAMNNGIGNVQAQIQKSSTNTSEKSDTQTQNQITNFGPGAMFGNSSMPSLPGL